MTQTSYEKNKKTSNGAYFLLSYSILSIFPYSFELGGGTDTGPDLCPKERQNVSGYWILFFGD